MICVRRGRALAGLLLAVAPVMLAGCQGRLKGGPDEARAIPSGLAPAAQNPQFIGSDPLPQLALDKPRPRRSAPSPTSGPRPTTPAPLPGDL